MKSKYLLIGLILFIVLISGCVRQREEKGVPSLPTGFENFIIPNTPNIDAILYVNQGVPFTYSGKFLVMPVQIDVESSGIWLLPTNTKEVLSGFIDFASTEEANAVYNLALDANSSDLWVMTSRNKLYFVHESSDDSLTMRKYIQTENLIGFQDRYPEVHDIISQLPRSPPTKPIAVGIIKPTDNLRNGIMELTKFETNEYIETLSKAGIDQIIISIYSPKTIEVAKILSMQDIKKLDLSALMVGKSSYPGPLLGIFFWKKAPNAGFTKITVNGKTAYHNNYDGLHVILANSGSYILVSISHDESQAKNLLASALS